MLVPPPSPGLSIHESTAFRSSFRQSLVGGGLATVGAADSTPASLVESHALSLPWLLQREGGGLAALTNPCPICDLPSFAFELALSQSDLG